MALTETGDLVLPAIALFGAVAALFLPQKKSAVQSEQTDQPETKVFVKDTSGLTGVAKYLAQQEAVLKASQVIEEIVVAPVVSGVAKYLQAREQQPVSGVAKYMLKKSIAQRQSKQEADVAQTGVEKYLKNQKPAPALSGVAKYLKQQENLPQPSRVEKYMTRQAILAKQAKANEVPVKTTGVDRYLKQQENLPKTSRVSRYITRQALVEKQKPVVARTGVEKYVRSQNQV